MQPWGGIGTLVSVRRWPYILLGVVLILGIVIVYRYRPDLGLVSPPAGGNSQSARSGQTAAAAQPADIVWQSVDRSTDGFTVEMPTNIKQIQIPAYN